VSGQSYPPFEVIDHTADVGIIAYGRDFRELLENAALGMFSLMADLNTVQPREQRLILAQTPFPEPELLLLKWLKELHYLCETERFIACRATVARLSDREAEGFVEGEPLRDGIVLLHHIKAVTHHLLKLGQVDGWLKVQVIFDV